MADHPRRLPFKKPPGLSKRALWSVVAAVLIASSTLAPSQSYVAASFLGAPIEEPDSLVSVAAPSETEDQALRIAPTVARGILSSAWWISPYGGVPVQWAMEEVKATGAGWVGLLVQAHYLPGASTEMLASRATPNDDQLIQSIQSAHDLGLKVMVKVDLSPLPGANQPTGNEEADRPDVLFANYRDYLEHYADLAESRGADLLGLGSGLVALADGQPWMPPLPVLARSRYTGPITYWSDGSTPSPGQDWWGAVGYSGVSARFALKEDPALSDSVATEEGAPGTSTLSANIERPVLLTEADQGSVGAGGLTWRQLLDQEMGTPPPTVSQQQALGRITNRIWFAGMFWGSGSLMAAKGDGTASDITPAPQAGGSTGTSGSAIASLNNRFLMLNMHGALFHPDLADVREDIAYARWMRAGVIRVFATDGNSYKSWDGRQVGNRIAEVAPALRAANVKLLVALVNNHQPVPGESADSSGWMDGYYQLLLPFYNKNWRGPYLQFTRDLITTVKERGALDVIYAWELGNELHTPQDPPAIMTFITNAVEEIRKLDGQTPILPGTMGANHLQPWWPKSPIARWLYCEAPVDGYTLHAYDWVERDRQGDMPIVWDLENITVEPCRNGRRLPVIVEELGTSKELPWVYVADQEYKRLDQELKQLRFVLSYPQVIGVGAWNGESPRVVDRAFHDNRRGLTSYGPGATGGGSAYDPRPAASPGFRAQLEQILRNLPSLP